MESTKKQRRAYILMLKKQLKQGKITKQLCETLILQTKRLGQEKHKQLTQKLNSQ